MKNRITKVQPSSVRKGIAKPLVSGSTFMWKYRYVNEGQLEPDEHGRWAIDCYMFFQLSVRVYIDLRT